MKALIITLLIIGVVGIVGYWMYVNRAPAFVPGTVPTSDAVRIETEAGNLTIDNPFKNSVKYNEKYQDLVMAQNLFYTIQFFAADQSFNITLLNKDIWTAREKAEADFLQRLGLTQEEACKLAVNLAVPASVNATAFGGNYGLSFCPGSYPLPNKETTPQQGLSNEE